VKAWVYTKYGSADELQLIETVAPIPADDQVLVKIHAVSINDWDWQLLQGTPFVNKMMNGLLKPRQQILGSDIAGQVEAVGAGVERFAPGDRVYGDLSDTWGGFAEYVCADEKSLAPIPDAMSFEDAAAIPQAGMLAVQGLRDVGRLQSGEKLLINGAGGGVGTFGIQLARLYEDVEVTGVDSGPKLEMLHGLGFDRVIDYTREDFTAAGRQYDLILDTKTNRPVSHYLRALRPGGRYVTVGGDRILQVLLLGPLVSMIRGIKLRLVMLKANKDLPFMNELYSAGRVKPVIDGPYPMEELQQAMRHFGAGEHRGKVVIRVAR